jgi:hypothetical protein
MSDSISLLVRPGVQRRGLAGGAATLQDWIACEEQCCGEWRSRWKDEFTAWVAEQRSGSTFGGSVATEEVFCLSEDVISGK